MLHGIAGILGRFQPGLVRVVHLTGLVRAYAVAIFQWPWRHAADAPQSLVAARRRRRLDGYRMAYRVDFLFDVLASLRTGAISW